MNGVGVACILLLSTLGPFLDYFYPSRKTPGTAQDPLLPSSGVRICSFRAGEEQPNNNNRVLRSGDWRIPICIISSFSSSYNFNLRKISNVPSSLLYFTKKVYVVICLELPA